MEHRNDIDESSTTRDRVDVVDSIAKSTTVIVNKRTRIMSSAVVANPSPCSSQRGSVRRSPSVNNDDGGGDDDGDGQDSSRYSSIKSHKLTSNRYHNYYHDGKDDEYDTHNLRSSRSPPPSRIKRDRETEYLSDRRSNGGSRNSVTNDYYSKSESKSDNNNHSRLPSKEPTKIPGTEWEEHVSRSNKIYYYNIVSQVSQWDMPKDVRVYYQRQRFIPINNNNNNKYSNNSINLNLLNYRSKKKNEQFAVNCRYDDVDEDTIVNDRHSSIRNDSRSPLPFSTSRSHHSKRRDDPGGRGGREEDREDAESRTESSKRSRGRDVSYSPPRVYDHQAKISSSSSNHYNYSSYHNDDLRDRLLSSKSHNNHYDDRDAEKSDRHNQKRSSRREFDESPSAADVEHQDRTPPPTRYFDRRKRKPSPVEEEGNKRRDSRSPLPVWVRRRDEEAIEEDVKDRTKEVKRDHRDYYVRSDRTTRSPIVTNDENDNGYNRTRRSRSRERTRNENRSLSPPIVYDHRSSHHSSNGSRYHSHSRSHYATMTNDYDHHHHDNEDNEDNTRTNRSNYESSHQSANYSSSSRYEVDDDDREERRRRRNEDPDYDSRHRYHRDRERERERDRDLWGDRDSWRDRDRSVHEHSVDIESRNNKTSTTNRTSRSPYHHHHHNDDNYIGSSSRRNRSSSRGREDSGSHKRRLPTPIDEDENLNQKVNHRYTNRDDDRRRETRSRYDDEYRRRDRSRSNDNRDNVKRTRRSHSRSTSRPNSVSRRERTPTTTRRSTTPQPSTGGGVTNDPGLSPSQVTMDNLDQIIESLSDSPGFPDLRKLSRDDALQTIRQVLKIMKESVVSGQGSSSGVSESRRSRTPPPTKSSSGGDSRTSRNLSPSKQRSRDPRSSLIHSINGNSGTSEGRERNIPPPGTSLFLKRSDLTIPSPSSEVSDYDDAMSVSRSPIDSGIELNGNGVIGGGGGPSSSSSDRISSSLSSALVNNYREDFIKHVKGWQSEYIEKECNRLAEESLTLGSINCTRVSAELKMARSLVRFTEIQATLQEQRILFVRQQMKEVEEWKSQYVSIN